MSTLTIPNIINCWANFLARNKGRTTPTGAIFPSGIEATVTSNEYGSILYISFFSRVISEATVITLTPFISYWVGNSEFFTIEALGLQLEDCLYKLTAKLFKPVREESRPL